MSADRHEQLEDLVEAFLDRREQEPSLTPEQFAAENHDAPDGLLHSLQASLDVIGALGEDLDPLPDYIGNYRVRRELGRGGMGVVYEAEHDGRQFAIKRLSVAAMLQPRARQRFHREATALGRVRHPGIVAIHDVGTADGLPYLVMDCVAGQSLATVGALPWRRAVEIVRDVANALAAVHAAGLCHRDLKPENIVLRPDGAPIVVDFGLVHDAADDSLTATGDLLGTPRYLAPEQAEGRPADARTDVHALGLVLMELLTGEPVRKGVERSTLLATAVRGLTPSQVPKLAAAPRSLALLVRTAAARRPGDRYHDASAMAAELERVLAGEAILARPPGVLAYVRDFVHFHPRISGIAAGLLLTATLIGGFLWRDSEITARQRQATASFERAVVHWLDHDTDAVRSAADATIAEDATHVGASALLVLNELQPTSALSADEPLHRGVILRIAADWPASHQAFAEAVRRQPTCPLARILLAQALEKVAQLAEADGQLTSAAQMLPNSASMAEALAGLRHRRGDHRGAAIEYRRAIAIEPRSFGMRWQLARCCAKFDYEAALTELLAAEPLLSPSDDARSLELLNLRAALLDKLGRSEAALPIFEQLHQRHPDDARVLFNLAYTLDRLLRVREAKPHYEHVLRLQPENVHARLCLTWLLTTAADETLRDLERAEELLNETLRQDLGKTASVLQMVREFGLRTGRIDKLTGTLQTLAEREDLSQQRRAKLTHTRSYLLNGAPSGRR